MPSHPEELSSLSAAIDQIDDQIHDLIVHRASLVEQSAARSSGDRAAAIHPAREAIIMRRLAARHSGPLPFRVVARQWREMLAGMIGLHGPYSVAVYVPEGDRGIWDLARDHYGATTPMSAVTDPLHAIRMVVEGRASVSVLPWPDDHPVSPWWQLLVGEDAKMPRVAARLPSVASPTPDAASALAVALVPSEPSGDDRSLVALEIDETMSRARLRSALISHGLDPSAFWSCEARGRSDGALHLVEVTDFVAPKDPRLARLSESLGNARVICIGSYACPLVMPEMKREPLIPPAPPTTDPKTDAASADADGEDRDAQTDQEDKDE